MNSRVYAYGGDALTAPDHTETAVWAALGGGASGVVMGVRLTKDGVAVCVPHDTLERICGDDRAVDSLTYEEIEALDAGAVFRSTVLNALNQPTGVSGEDVPWAGAVDKKRPLRVMSLSRLLTLFGRRCEVILRLPDGGREIAAAAVGMVKALGLSERVGLLAGPEICDYLRRDFSGLKLVYRAPVGGASLHELQAALERGAQALYLDWSSACERRGEEVVFDVRLERALETHSMPLFLGSDATPFAVEPAFLASLKGCGPGVGVVARGTLPTVEGLTPPALVMRDDFEGTRMDSLHWAAGYSHANQDTEIYQNDGVHIDIVSGGSYSGAAAVCLIPIHGRFDVQVDFAVASPQQGTTFEMAAICIDPGYMHMDHSDLNTRNVNLTFDVHGAAPYASSERDEDDGFRCGWNNGFNLTKVDSDWTAASVNMYNKYGRDVGCGAADSPTGSLRLVRNGAVFSTYYRDRFNAAWVCSGMMLVQNMSDDVFIRLAAKHWNKGGRPAPGNRVTFNQFKLYQF
jgi:hypothetical protein